MHHPRHRRRRRHHLRKASTSVRTLSSYSGLAYG